VNKKVNEKICRKGGEYEEEAMFNEKRLVNRKAKRERERERELLWTGSLL
jgi:hypothetical protein